MTNLHAIKFSDRAIKFGTYKDYYVPFDPPLVFYSHSDTVTPRRPNDRVWEYRAGDNDRPISYEDFLPRPVLRRRFTVHLNPYDYTVGLSEQLTRIMRQMTGEENPRYRIIETEYNPMGTYKIMGEILE